MKEAPSQAPTLSASHSPDAAPLNAALAQSDLRLRGGWLLAARVTWVLAAVVVLGLNALGTPTMFRLMHLGCDGDRCINLQLTTAQMASFLASGLSRTVYAFYATALYWAGALVYIAIAAIIFWRRSDDRMALLGSFTLLVFGAGSVFNIMQALSYVDAVWVQPIAVIGLVGTVAFYTFFCIFPSGHFVPRWMRWAALTQIAGPLLGTIPYPPLQAIVESNITFGVLYGLLVFAQAYRYLRVSTPVEGQQTKWVVLLGFVIGLGGFLAVLALTGVVQGARWTATPAAIFFFTAALSVPLWLIPISIGVAILRSRLWDIDVIVRRTLIYGSLTAILAAVYFAVVVAAQAIGERLTGQTQPPAWLIVVTTLAIAALFTPLRRRIQRIIDHRFYRSRYNATCTVETFAATLRSEVDLGNLSTHLTDVVEQTMHPAGVSLWLAPRSEAHVPDASGNQ